MSYISAKNIGHLRQKYRIFCPKMSYIFFSAVSDKKYLPVYCRNSIAVFIINYNTFNPFITFFYISL